MKIPDHFKIPEGLAFLYCSFANLTDGNVEQSELLAATEKLAEWQMSLEDARKAMVTALDFWSKLDHESEVQCFAQAAVLLKGHMDPPQRLAILHDLIAIAQADGEIADGELTMVGHLQELWEIK